MPSPDESAVRSRPANDRPPEVPFDSDFLQAEPRERESLAEGRSHSNDKTVVFSESALRAKAAARPGEHMKHDVEEVNQAYRRGLENDPTVSVSVQSQTSTPAWESPSREVAPREVPRSLSPLPPRLTMAQQAERERMQTEASVINTYRLQQKRADDVRRAEQEARLKANPALRHPLEQQIRAREEREAQEAQAKTTNRPRVVVTGEAPRPIPLAQLMEAAQRPADVSEEDIPYLDLDDGDIEEIPAQTISRPPQVTTIARNTMTMDQAKHREIQDRQEEELGHLIAQGARERLITPDKRAQIEAAQRALQAVRRTQWPSAPSANEAA